MRGRQIIDRLRFAIEDRFLILNLWEPTAMLPTGSMLEDLVRLLGTFRPGYSLVCDARDVETVTTDLVEFLDVIADFEPTILVGKSIEAEIRDELRCRRSTQLPGQILPLRSHPPNFEFVDLPIPPPPPGTYHIGPHLEGRWEDMRRKIDVVSPLTELEFRLLQNAWPSSKLGDEWPTRSDFLAALGSSDPQTLGGVHAALGLSHIEHIHARRWIEAKIPILARNSLLTHFTLQSSGSDIVAAPYHGLAVHEVEGTQGIILARPSVLASKAGMIFSDVFGRFSALLSRSPKEVEIQRFLESFPEVFQALGYVNVYPRVVLQRDDDTALIPDFILQPIGDEWCDILDIKLPRKALVVGRRDRKTLAAGIHELVAQLREYGAYFEDTKYARRIRDRYGINCYRPRLIGVTGAAVEADDRQLRRLMTAYADVRLISFDQLLAIARSRILI